MGHVIEIGRNGVSGKGGKAIAEMAARMAAKKARSPEPKAEKLKIVEPTPEQIGAFNLETITDKLPGGTQITLGKTYRRKPVIKTLYEQNLFTDAEYKALKHYRHHAELVDRSIVRDSLCMESYGGNGNGPTIEMLNASDVVSAVESAAGALLDILRAVVVEDKSLSQWAMEKFGALEDCEVKKGRRVCRLKPRQNALAIAKQDIKMAAQRVEAELSA